KGRKRRDQESNQTGAARRVSAGGRSFRARSRPRGGGSHDCGGGDGPRGADGAFGAGQPVGRGDLAVTAFLIALVKGYRLAFAPFFGPCCRFVPSCSHYA